MRAAGVIPSEDDQRGRLTLIYTFPENYESFRLWRFVLEQTLTILVLSAYPILHIVFEHGHKPMKAERFETHAGIGPETTVS